MSSVRAIAKEAGVSITTVSRALNDGASVHPKTRERILAVANNCGYVPTIGKRVTTQIGVCYTRSVTISDPFDASVVGGIARGLDECKFDMVVLNMERDKKSDESYTQFFLRKGVRGVILRTVADTRHMCEAVAEERFPHVVISDRFEQPDVNYIDCDSRPGTTQAVEYLLSLGHRHVGFSMHHTQDRDHLDRFEGYKTALANYGIDFEERLVFRHPYTKEGGAAAMNMAVSMRPRPTAIFFADPLTAIGGVKRAYELGVSIPNDMSIVGFDDTDARYAVHPTLTAVCQDAARLGYEAALWLTRSVTQRKGSSLRRTIPTYFEVNQSTSPPLDVNGAPASAGVMARTPVSTTVAVPDADASPEQ